MKHHQYNKSFNFVVDPVNFDKYTDKVLLQYCLGATMYMPGHKNFVSDILTKKYLGLTTMVLCFEDACKVEDVPAAEENSFMLLNTLNAAIKSGEFLYEDLPLIVFRVRNVDQFRSFSSRLTPEHIKLITAFNFPKFNSENGEAYFNHLVDLNRKFGEIIYGMPILEDRKVAFKESRMPELLKIKPILDHHKDLVLNIRVGGTDFSSCFGMRRGINYSIYDIMTVRECLSDILNVFTRDNDFTISGPVWEYFRASKEMRWKKLPEFDFTESLLNRTEIVNDAVDGLLRELILDRANGFIGKTIIHPTHLRYVNGMMAITKEEYEDALQILNANGGVLKSLHSNKMNEVGPHRNWAEKMLFRAKAYGVVENQSSYIDLFSE
ncbi:MAG: HpcH/HpaI aldolase/citrate lyase family protein [Clostridium sp.]|nr:HpcH/HpaI aldolase/citrate lyase family protein [Clostridium sp.]